MVSPHNFPSRIFHLPAPVDWSAKTDSPVFDLGRSVSLFNPPAFFCPFTVITTQGKAVLGSTWIFRFYPTSAQIQKGNQYVRFRDAPLL